MAALSTDWSGSLQLSHRRAPSSTPPRTPHAPQPRSRTPASTPEAASFQIYCFILALLLWRYLHFKRLGKQELNSTRQDGNISKHLQPFYSQRSGESFHFIFTSKGKENAFFVSLSSVCFCKPISKYGASGLLGEPAVAQAASSQALGCRTRQPAPRPTSGRTAASRSGLTRPFSTEGHPRVSMPRFRQEQSRFQ